VAKVVNLTLKRENFTEKTTTGGIYLDTFKLCDTLEDKDRKLETAGAAAKVQKRTAIPRGRYELQITWSNRFKKYMIQVMEVPYFEGVRLHAGNTHEDTEGCPLLGDLVDDYTLVNSRMRTNEVFDMVEKALKTEKVWLEVI
jgi:hypothetical protein